MKIEDAKKILEYHKDELKDAPCSTNHHLNIRGGLLQHLYNVNLIALENFRDDEELIALVLIHDIGKARTYKYNNNDIIIYSIPSVDHLINTIAMISKTGYRLTQEELHALQYHHGGWSPFSKNANLTELAIKLHYCDMIATTRENNLC